MTSTLTLYYKSLINKDKNFILDKSNGKSAIENYLTTLESQVISGYQYVKHGLAVTIKLNKSQDELMMGHNARDLNYIKIQNGSENPYYYFIVKKDWKSENTIELLLNMDTLNTFEFNKDYEINKKTFVKREHNNRFSSFTPEMSFDWTFNVAISQNPNVFFYTNTYLARADVISYSYVIVREDNPGQQTYILEPWTNDLGVKGFRVSVTTIAYAQCTIRVTYKVRALYREIDLRSEEINAPVYKKKEQILIEQNGRSTINWALYYKNSSNQENAPVDCFLVPDNSINFDYQAGGGELNTTNVPNNKVLVFCSTYASGALTFKYGNNTYTLSTGDSQGVTDEWNVLAVFNDNGTLKTYTCRFIDTEIHGFVGKWTQVYTGSISIENSPSSVYALQRDALPTAYQWNVEHLYSSSAGTYLLNMGGLTSATLHGKSSIDRTDPTNIKIIDLPYSPTNYTENDGTYSFATCWAYDANSGRMSLSTTDYSFSNDVQTDAENILLDYIQGIPSIQNLVQEQRFIKDSKLFHSDYYRPKFVYDSFTKVFQLEKIEFNKNEEVPQYFSFTFVTSRNIVSKFLFKFNYTWKYATEDYENIVAVARNNEEVLYNSSYINYLKTGYNYDLKAKERQEVASMAGLGLTIAGLVGSIALTASGYGSGVGVGGIIGSVTGIVAQSINLAKTTAQNEENIQRKLQETQNQSVSVLNADDVDLLTAYSSNKAKLCLYNVSETMEKILDDLFYYGGYVCNEQKIPNVKSRYWFNYVQASLVLEETNNLTEEIENDIKEKFENGVTFMHLRNNTFDLKQEKENMETSIVGG